MNDTLSIGALLPLLLALTLPSASALAQRREPVAPIVKGELGARLDAYMTRLSAFGMSGSLLVAKGGEVILDKGYGLADRKRGVPVEPSTPFMIGSLSKQFTAAAILKLEMEGKLSTSDTLGRFFPGAPADKRGITLHQLLTHTASLPYLADGMSPLKSRAQVLDDMLKLPLTAKPGTEFAYSSPGYTLLAGVIEKVSGESYEDYLRRGLFAPAGMTATGFPGDTARWGDAPTHSYSGRVDEGTILGFPVPQDIVGAGTIISTPADLYKWEIALQGNAILSDAAKRKFFSPQVTTQGTGGYGYGWHVTKTIRGTTLIFHPGDLGGYNAEYRRYVDENLVVIFTSNARLDGAGYRQVVMNPISLLIAGGDIPQPPAAASLPGSALASYAGIYTLPSGGKLHVRVEDGKVMIGADDQAGIAALSGGVPKDSASQAFLTARTVSMAREVAAGNFEQLLRNLHPSLPADDMKRQLIMEWAAHRDSLGALRSVEPIGTALPAPMAARSYYRLRFERGEIIEMYGWTAGKVTAIESGLAEAATTQFVPESAATLASFDPLTGRIVRIGVTTAPDGSIAELTVANPAGTIHARRG